MKLKDSERSSHLFDLTPDRNLVDPKFSGYKLSLEPVPIQTIELDTAVDKVGPSDEQFSLLHVTLFATQNLIFSHPLWKNTIFYIDTNWDVFKVAVIGQTDRLSTPLKVWNIPHHPSKNVVGRFNVSLIFQENLALLTDGCGRLFLLQTNDSDELWIEVFQTTFSSSPASSSVENKSFCLLDAVCYNESNSDFIDILTLQVDDTARWKDKLEAHEEKYLASSDNAFITMLQWKTLVTDRSTNWTTKSSRVLVGRKELKYASIEPGGSAVYIASDGPFYLVEDSENPITLPSKEDANDTNDDDKKPDYLWSESSEGVTIWFNLSETTSIHDIKVDVNPQTLSIQFKNQPMLEGPLFGIVKADATVWTLEGGKLEITLEKAEGAPWTELVPGNKSGEQIVDPEMIQEIHSRLAHLCSDKWGTDPIISDTLNNQQLEDCDVFPADTSLLMRIDKALQTTTDQASLGSHQWLFSTRTTCNKVKAICVRHDVDGMIWQPQLDSSTTTSNAADDHKMFHCKHIGTFSALGYVQASKVLRKFTECAPDMSYVAICDASKHIYVYRQPAKVENQLLRNRKTGEHVSHVATQQVVSIDPPVEILGSFASSDFLFILTSRHLHALRMKTADDI